MMNGGRPRSQEGDVLASGFEGGNLCVECKKAILCFSILQFCACGWGYVLSTKVVAGKVCMLLPILVRILF